MYVYDVKVGQKRKWFKSRRVFTVGPSIEGTAFYLCYNEDGTEERHDRFIINCKSYIFDDDTEAVKE